MQLALGRVALLPLVGEARRRVRPTRKKPRACADRWPRYLLVGDCWLGCAALMAAAALVRPGGGALRDPDRRHRVPAAPPARAGARGHVLAADPRCAGRSRDLSAYLDWSIHDPAPGGRREKPGDAFRLSGPLRAFGISAVARGSDPQASRDPRGPGRLRRSACRAAWPGRLMWTSPARCPPAGRCSSDRDRVEGRSGPARVADLPGARRTHPSVGLDAGARLAASRCVRGRVLRSLTSGPGLRVGETDSGTAGAMLSHWVAGPSRPKGNARLLDRQEAPHRRRHGRRRCRGTRKPRPSRRFTVQCSPPSPAGRVG